MWNVLSCGALYDTVLYQMMFLCAACVLQASRDYCAGQPPDLAASAAADTLGYSLTPPAAAAPAAAAAAEGGNKDAAAAADGGGGVSVFNPLEDIVAADLVLVMDKYTAADVLREVRAWVVLSQCLFVCL